MSIGNINSSGDKKNNWPWQHKMLKGLQGIIAAINTTKDGTEYEAKLVNITCTGVPFAGTELYLEVRVWDTDSGGWDGPPTYYLPGDNTGVPLLTFTAAGCTIEYLEVGDASEATLELCRLLLVDIEANTDPITGVTPALLRPTTSGSVAAGARSVSIANVGAESGTVLGIELAAGETVNFDAGSLNNTLGAVTYDPTTPGAGTTFLIATLT
jgi:hypothetical protein